MAAAASRSRPASWNAARPAGDVHRSGTSARGSAGVPVYNMDAWDGYPQARRRLLDAARAAGAPNLVVLTGDMHCSIVGDLELDGTVVGSEFVGPAISSPFPKDRAPALALAPFVLPQVKLAQGTSQGYLSCTVDTSRWRTDYRWVRTVARPESDLTDDGPGYVVDAGRPGARRAEPGAGPAQGPASTAGRSATWSTWSSCTLRVRAT